MVSAWHCSSRNLHGTVAGACLLMSSCCFPLLNMPRHILVRLACVGLCGASAILLFACHWEGLGWPGFTLAHPPSEQHLTRAATVSEVPRIRVFLLGLHPASWQAARESDVRLLFLGSAVHGVFSGLLQVHSRARMRVPPDGRTDDCCRPARKTPGAGLAFRSPGRRRQAPK